METRLQDRFQKILAYISHDSTNGKPNIENLQSTFKKPKDNEAQKTY